MSGFEQMLEKQLKRIVERVDEIEEKYQGLKKRREDVGPDHPLRHVVLEMEGE